MRRGNTKGPGTLLLFLLSGIILGTIIGQVLAEYINHPLFTSSYKMGTEGIPAFIDLVIIRFAFGLTLIVNFGTALGVSLGLFFFFRS